MRSDFDDVRFPDDISYGTIGGPEYFTDIVSSVDGREYKNLKSLRSRARYKISYSNRTKKEMQEILCFFRARRGRAQGFRFKDWLDYSAVSQKIGVYDGVNNIFHLIKDYKSGDASYKRRIKKPVIGTIKLYDEKGDNIRFKADYNKGTVIIEDNVSKGSLIKADFEFDIPVRFAHDHLPISADKPDVYSAKDIELLEILL